MISCFFFSMMIEANLALGIDLENTFFKTRNDNI